MGPLFSCAETEHMFYHRAIVPRPIEQHHLTRRGQMLDVALKIPLTGLGLGLFLQGHGTHDAWIEVLADPFDRAPFSRGIATFKDHDDAFALGFDCCLRADQLDLQMLHLCIIPRAV